MRGVEEEGRTFSKEPFLIFERYIGRFLQVSRALVQKCKKGILLSPQSEEQEPYKIHRSQIQFWVASSEDALWTYESECIGTVASH